MRCFSAGFRSVPIVPLFAAVMLLAILGATPPAAAQPFDAWFTASPGYPTTHGFVQIPHNAILNPTAGFTFEAWVRDTVADGPGEDCRTIAGKNYLQAWWVGICNVGGVRTLRSYIKAGGSQFNGGRVTVGQWTHLAVTWDGTNRRHYINGELTGTQALAGPLTTSTSEMRIGSDVSWERSPNGSIDEVRLWSVARSTTQLRESLNVRINTLMPGLIGVWPLSGNGNNIVGAGDGVLTGTGVNFLISAVAADCGSQTATKLCLAEHFQVTSKYRTGPQTNAEGTSQTIPCAGAVCENSGIFWFFEDVNWELMVKVLNGCDITEHWWVFNAGLTNQFFRLEVTDVTKGETKIYFNYPGPPAPAITDTTALDTCPP